MLYLQNTQYMIKIQSNQIKNSNNFSANMCTVKVLVSRVILYIWITWGEWGLIS